MFKATDCAFTTASNTNGPGKNFDIYRPSKHGSNCPLPLTTRTLIKSGWVCSDAVALKIGATVTGKSINECDNLCKNEPLCVWFMIRSTDGECSMRK